MKLVGAVSVGSSPELLDEVRRQKRLTSANIVNKLLNASRAVILFPEGSIGDGVTVSIRPYLHGAYDMIAQHPEKPVLMVTLRGLEKSARNHWWERPNVSIDIKRFDNISLIGGPEGFNQRLERYFNEGASLHSVPKLAVG